MRRKSKRLRTLPLPPAIWPNPWLEMLLVQKLLSITTVTQLMLQTLMVTTVKNLFKRKIRKPYTVP